MTTMRTISFILIFLSALFLPLWVFSTLSFFYAIRYTSYELLVIGILVDAQFGTPPGGLWYAYTLIAAVILVVAEHIKPHLRFYH